GQLADAERELALEPRLDVLAEGLLVARGLPDDLVEGLVDLGLDGRHVGEAREMRQELRDLAVLAAREVHPELAVHHAAGRHVAEDRRGWRGTGQRVDRGGTDGHDDGDRAEGDRPSASSGPGR